MWATDSGRCLKTLVDDDNPIWYVFALALQTHSEATRSGSVAFSPNSKFILASTQDSTVRLWDYNSSRCLKTYAGHLNRTYCIPSSFSITNGMYVVSGSEDGKIYMWDLQSRKIVQVLEGHRGSSLCLSVSGEG